jgi:hypothetical protein
MSQEEKERLLFKVFLVLIVILFPILLFVHICLKLFWWIESLERTFLHIRVLKVLVYGPTKWRSLTEIAQESNVKETIAAEVVLALVERHSLAYRMCGSLLPDDFSNEERTALQQEKPDYSNCGYFEYKYRTGNNKRKKWYECLEIEKRIPAHAH